MKQCVSMYTCFEFTVKHCFSADKELVCDSLSETEAIFQRRAVYSSNERLAQRKLVDLLGTKIRGRVI